MSTYAAPKGGYRVRVASSDPSKVLTSSDRNKPGGAQATGMIGEGSLVGTTADFFLQAIESSGQVTITAAAAGLPAATAKATLQPSGFILDSATLSLSVGDLPQNIQVWPVSIDPRSGHPDTFQDLRPGLSPFSVEVVTPVGVLQNIPIAFLQSYGAPMAQFKPLTTGDTILTVLQPAGFVKPASETTKRVVVGQR